MIGIVDTNELVQEPEEDLTGEACSDPRGLPPDLVEAGMSDERKRLKEFAVFNVRKRNGWDGVLVDGKWVHYLRKNKKTGKWCILIIDRSRHSCTLPRRGTRP